MCKRIVSIILIVFLLFTISTPLTGSIFSYADDNDTLTDTEKVQLASMTYYNYRNSWFKSTTPATVPSLIYRYISTFYDDPANTTSIHSLSDFVAELTIDNNDGHWKVTISNEGLVFLDELCKELLHKGIFPNLYAPGDGSGGSWGQQKTSDSVYDGLEYGGYVFTIVNADLSTVSSQKVGVVSSDNITLGVPYKAQDYDFFVNKYESEYGSISWLDSSTSNPGTLTVTVDIPPATVGGTSTYDMGISIFGQQAYSNYRPILGTSALSISGTDANLNGKIYCQRGSQIRGFFGLIKIVSSNNPAIYARGMITHNPTTGNYIIRTTGIYPNNNTPPGTNNCGVDLDTNDFDRNDVGDDSDPDALSQTFTPKYTTDDGDTYNYYTTENNTTVKNFYNNYVNNYSTVTNNEYNSTVINQSDNEDEPQEPETPGGTEPPWTDNNQTGAGTLTPNGSDGFNLSLPDLTLPDLNIDWSINGLKDKFPFSIPWDLMAFFTVLNAEPETPYIEGTIDLKIVQWEIDWNLHQFDNLARLLRNLEFIGFCIALIIITRNMIKG